MRAVNSILRSLFLALLTACLAAATAAYDADILYRDGLALYEAGRYADAVPLLEQAVAGAPDRAEYHLTLGKAYGRLAERSHWWQALKLAGRTRAEFETAVRLDPDNVSALEYLRKYYREAPGFLGGDTDKAAEIDRRLEEIRRNSL
jgi:tetratricopeptide (TPR) repeat protein